MFVLSLTQQELGLWFLVLGLLGLAAMGADKGMARLNRGDRISERSLWLIALAGGFLGIILGALLFHHKTSKGEFWPPVLLAVVLWVGAGALLFGYLRL
ncbi:MAG: DUF1294 domain-containing protein [Thaumarchaeota archaeon]|nr:DUF1294 domain-containing protein [Nitrososphaerota archaeon]